MGSSRRWHATERTARRARRQPRPIRLARLGPFKPARSPAGARTQASRPIRIRGMRRGDRSWSRRGPRGADGTRAMEGYRPGKRDSVSVGAHRTAVGSRPGQPPVPPYGSRAVCGAEMKCVLSARCVVLRTLNAGRRRWLGAVSGERRASESFILRSSLPATTCSGRAQKPPRKPKESHWPTGDEDYEPQDRSDRRNRRDRSRRRSGRRQLRLRKPDGEAGQGQCAAGPERQPPGRR